MININNTLCDNLLREVFLKLDPNSLVQSQLVCKKWHHLISENPIFGRNLLFKFKPMTPLKEIDNLIQRGCLYHVGSETLEHLLGSCPIWFGAINRDQVNAYLGTTPTLNAHLIRQCSRPGMESFIVISKKFDKNEEETGSTIDLKSLSKHKDTFNIPKNQKIIDTIGLPIHKNQRTRVEHHLFEVIQTLDPLGKNSFFVRTAKSKGVQDNGQLMPLTKFLDLYVNQKDSLPLTRESVRKNIEAISKKRQKTCKSPERLIPL